MSDGAIREDLPDVLSTLPAGGVSRRRVSRSVGSATRRRARCRVVEKCYLENATSSKEVAKLIHLDATNQGPLGGGSAALFYLPNLDWADFVKRTGFTRVDVSQEYDFALSFVGEDGAFAEKLNDHLEQMSIDLPIG